jgi:hypothetical protein
MDCCASASIQSNTVKPRDLHLKRTNQTIVGQDDKNQIKKTKLN